MALFPVIEPYQTHFLPVSDTHTLYVEECGNPNGVPVVFLHGGPGGAINPNCRRYFDPAFYRIILFDQRGAGKSTPTACIRENTPDFLVQDMEYIREFLKIDQWLVFGGSWGTTLALYYAILHTECVSGLILRGVFLGRQEDVDWLYQEGASYFYPQEWERYVQFIPEEERHHFIAAYYKRLTTGDSKQRLEAAKQFASWENQVVFLIPKEAEPWTEESEQAALNMATMETHFFVNGVFAEDNYILNHAHLLAHLPVHIVHGRYDIDCRPIGAYLLHQALPQSKLTFVNDAGHAMSEPGITKALLEATQWFKGELA